MRAAGLRRRRDARAAARAAVAPGVTTAELDAIAEDVHPRAAGRSRRSSATTASPPRSARRSTTRSCTASPAPRVLREGDSSRIDCGAIVDGWHGDAAITVPVGDVPARADRAHRGSARSRCGAGSPPPASAAGSRTSATRSRRTSAAQGDFGIVEEYGGHGIGTEMHQDPHVPNYGAARARAQAGEGTGPGRRADGHGAAARAPACSTTSGPW